MRVCYFWIGLIACLYNWSKWTTNAWLYTSMFNRKPNPLASCFSSLRPLKETRKGKLIFIYYLQCYVAFIYHLFFKNFSNESERIESLSSIDQKSTLPIEDQDFSDDSSLNKNYSDNCQPLGHLPMEIVPVPNPGELLLSENETNVSCITQLTHLY